MLGFDCASEFGNFVLGQGKPAVVIEGVWREAIDILLVMERSSHQSCEERAFRDALGIEEGETSHGLLKYRM